MGYGGVHEHNSGHDDDADDDDCHDLVANMYAHGQYDDGHDHDEVVIYACT